MEIIQITGYKNSGKTTFAERLIHLLTKRGFRVGSLKHHGHGGTPIGIENTDSEKHRRAGAFLAGVEGEGVFQLAANPPLRFSEMTAIYRMRGTEILVVEGFKYEPHPKIVMLGKPEDVKLLDTLTNIQAVVTAIEIDIKGNPYPVYTHSEAEELCEWLCEKFARADT